MLDVNEILKQSGKEGLINSSLPENTNEPKAGIDKGIEEFQQQGLDIVDNVLRLLEDEGEDFMILDSLGVNTSESKSKVMEAVSTTYAEEVVKNITYSEPTEGFNEYELNVLSEVIIDSNEGEVKNNINQELLPMEQEVMKLDDWYAQTSITKRNAEVRLLKNYDFIESLQSRIGYIGLYRDGNTNAGKFLTEEEKANPGNFLVEYDAAILEQPNLQKTIEQCEAGMEKQKKMITALRNKILERHSELTDERLKSVTQQISDLSSTLAKIVEIEFGSEFKEKGANFDFYVKCQCGTCSPHNYPVVTKVITGDVFYDFKDRMYTDKEVKVNRFSKSTKGLENVETKYKLLPDKDKYRRLVIPGVSNEDQAMVCPSCEKKLIPPVEVLEKMIAYGHIVDTYSLEASKHKFWESAPVTPGLACSVYVSSGIWGTLFNPELFKSTEIKSSAVSTDFRVKDTIVDSNQKSVVSLTEEERVLIVAYLQSKAGDIVDASNIKNDLEGMKRSINTTKRELESKFRRLPIGEHVDEVTYSRLTEKNKVRRHIRRILENSSFIEMCLLTPISSLELESMFKENMDVVRKVQKQLNEFSRKKVINRILGNTLEFYKGEWVVVPQDTNTPQYKFFLMYKDSIYEYLKSMTSMADSSDRISRMDSLLRYASNYYYDKDTDKAYNMEKHLKRLREDMSHILEQTREKAIDTFISKHGFEALTDSEGFAPCWLVEDLILFDIDQFEPKNLNMFIKLYPKEDL